MSRAFTPPDTLSQDDIKTVADVRRAVWINGLFGLGAGSVTGMSGHLVLQTLQRRYVPEVVVGGADDVVAKKDQTAKTKVISTATNTTKNKNTLMYKLLKPLPPLTKNTFLLSFLAGGALGSFVLSSTAGKNIVHLLHPIFNVGRDEYAGLSPYQIQARQQSESTTLTASAMEEQQDNDEQLDIQHHKQRTLHRKSSIKERLESGHSLSDTHSTEAHYIPQHPLDEEDVKKSRAALHRAERWERRQTERRKWVKDRIETGGGLSDSRHNVTGGGGGRS